MLYRSTRGQAPAAAFSEVAVAGLAPDGGLYVPESIPSLDLTGVQSLSYPELAYRVMKPFCPDVPDLRTILDKSYDERYGTVVRWQSDPWGGVLELFGGPTYSFKDVALQFLGRLLESILQERNERLNLLVATSGDTGSAALYSVVGRARLSATVMFPGGRISPLQELQMTTLLEPNTHCLALDGTFDDCQAILKGLLRNLPIKQALRLGAVNSVNWARMLAQSVYYVWLYAHTGKPLNVAVPTGNFGNFLSAWLAARMGVPVERLILAVNENDIVHRFFQGGRYERTEVQATLAPAMDIQVASNLERFFFFQSGGDAERVRNWMHEFESTGGVSIDTPTGEVEILTGRATREDILQAIRTYYAATGRALCPHTAVAFHVAQQFGGNATVVGTAHPGKFPEAVEEALGQPLPPHPGLERLRDLPHRMTHLPARAEIVQEWLEQRLIV